MCVHAVYMLCTPVYMYDSNAVEPWPYVSDTQFTSLKVLNNPTHYSTKTDVFVYEITHSTVKTNKRHERLIHTDTASVIHSPQVHRKIDHTSKIHWIHLHPLNRVNCNNKPLLGLGGDGPKALVFEQHTSGKLCGALAWILNVWQPNESMESQEFLSQVRYGQGFKYCTSKYTLHVHIHSLSKCS